MNRNDIIFEKFFLFFFDFTFFGNNTIKVKNFLKYMTNHINGQIITKFVFRILRAFSCANLFVSANAVVHRQRYGLSKMTHCFRSKLLITPFSRSYCTWYSLSFRIFIKHIIYQFAGNNMSLLYRYTTMMLESSKIIYYWNLFLRTCWLSM